ncbi:MAG: site-specific DNA-methyltransferase [Trichloromonadaceae bacterium]
MPILEFKGKQFVYSHHLSVPFRELKVDADKSLPAPGRKPSLDDNLIIHGDNLEALKALLPTHAGKIDCIFIDPPYNTGNEGWCYNDNVRSPLMKEWLKRSANPVDKEDLERHDKWLCMMWPRLNLLKELLSNDGFFFITIDDNEQSRLRNIMDEILGEDSFIANIVWQKAYSPRMDAQGFSKDNDHVLIYSKSKQIDAIKIVVDESGGENEVVRFRSWRKEGSSSLRSDRPNLWYPIEAPDGSKIYPVKPNGTEGRWRGNHDYFKDQCKQNKVEWKKNEAGWNVYIKQKVDSSKPRPPSTWWDSEYAGHNHDAAEQVKKILGPGIFQTPKPVELIRRLLEFSTDEDSIILDSFSGSGTTGHAVLEANKSDHGNRKFILIQLPEEIATDTPAYNAGFRDVCDITAERVRRVINGYAFTGTQREELFSEKLTGATSPSNPRKSSCRSSTSKRPPAPPSTR